MTGNVEARLTKAARAVENRRRNVELAEQLRDRTIREAVAAGLPHSRIAQLVGLTKARVTQIANS